jgi:hypothetical protein
MHFQQCKLFLYSVNFVILVFFYKLINLLYFWMKLDIIIIIRAEKKI